MLQFGSEQESEENLIPDQIQNLGYDTYNPTENLGTIALLTALYFSRVLYYFLVLTPLRNFTRFGHSHHKKMGVKLFFSEILMILIEGFLDFTISFFLYGFYDPVKEFGLSYVVCVITFFMVFVILPYIMI